MSRNWATISSVLSSAHVEAGVLDDWCRRWFQTSSRQGQEMSKRFFSVGCLVAAVGIMAVGLGSVGLHASARAGDKPNSWGFDTTNLDKTCKPCDDFYQFAMGGWMKSNAIPPEYSSWGSFTQLADKNQQNLRQILEAAAGAKASPGSNEQKIGHFYVSCMEAATVLQIETALANASMKNIDLPDPDKTYHKMMLADLKMLTPNFSWEAYFGAAGHAELKEINVGQPDFFKALDAQLTATPIGDWKAYLRWHLLNATAPGLPEKFVAEDFDFRGRTLTGAKEIQPRWKRCVQATDRVLGDALGQVYVQKYFPPEAKTRALEMVHNLISALRDDLQTLPWMGPATRKQATAKLAAFALKIGYTDNWRDYSTLKIDRRSSAENQWRGAEFDFVRRLNKIGKPVDRTEWGMTPPTVNAYNNSSMNEIVFPAGIMQPPFYDPNADDPVNYGGMCAVIGHEITHRFADHTTQCDAKANLQNC